MKDFARTFFRNRGAAAGSVWLVVMALTALFAPWLAYIDPLKVGGPTFAPPGPEWWFGTDNLGRDIYSGVVYGTRVSLMVGFLAALTASTIGIIVGAISGFFGGWVEALLMRVTEFFQVLPRFFVSLIIIALFGPGIERIIIVLGVLSWPPMARLIRAEFLSLKHREFVEAARAVGMGQLALCFRQILPNALPPAVVVGSLDIAQAILLEAGLSFFGLGDARLVSWGTLLFNAQNFLRHGWWMSTFPGVAIFLAVMSFNMVGDGINEALNPRLRER
jgi:peptide/nickel transport system permease protein